MTPLVVLLVCTLSVPWLMAKWSQQEVQKRQLAQGTRRCRSGLRHLLAPCTPVLHAIFQDSYANLSPKNAAGLNKIYAITVAVLKL